MHIFKVPLTMVESKEEKDGRAFFLRLEIPSLGSGAYQLILSANAQGSPARVVKSVRIE